MNLLWYSQLIIKLILLSQLSTSSRVRRVVGGHPAQIPSFVSSSNGGSSGSTLTTPKPLAESDRLVFVVKDRRSAVVDGIQNPDGTYSFLGLRYAEPPVKRLRFQRPKRIKLKGSVDAKKYGPPCPQWNRLGKLVGNEDCLYLNIFTPEVPSEDKNPSFPVLVWIHGGNFKSGSAAQYYPSELVKKGLVVVTVQYRLGSLGFLSLGRKELPGNAGLFDQAAAMRWIKEYIKFFGGDPKRIVPAGHGSGASCASMLALNPITRGKLRGVIAMSGSPVSPFSLDQNEQNSSKEVAEISNCASGEGLKFVRCMQQLPLETVLKSDSGVETNRKTEKSGGFPKGLVNLQTPGPAEEGAEDNRFLSNFILESPLVALQSGHFPKIPLLTGVTKQETSSGIQGNFLQDILKKLVSPSFLEGGLHKDLLYANTGLYVNKTANGNLVNLFSNGNYLKFFTSIVSEALTDVQKVIHHTTDAFFNLPAFLMSHSWSKNSDVFLYSFEHTPQKSTGSKFLHGIPLVSSNGTNNSRPTGPCHGDDLVYLFDVRDIYGEPLSENIEFNDDDKIVRDHFQTAVAEFARSGQPKRAGNNSDIWTPFDIKNGNYMKIDKSPRMVKHFHKCSMGLWTGEQDLLSSTECSLTDASKIVTNTIGSAGSGLLNAAGGVGNLLGGVTNTTKNEVNQLKSGLTNTTSGLTKSVGGITGSLGSLLGGSKEPAEQLQSSSSKSEVKPATTKPTTAKPTRKTGGLLGELGLGRK